MSEFNNSNFARKRKANEMDEPVPEGNNFKASDEEMKTRKIVRVVRNTEGEPFSNMPRGNLVYNKEKKMMETAPSEIGQADESGNNLEKKDTINNSVSTTSVENKSVDYVTENVSKKVGTGKLDKDDNPTGKRLNMTENPFQANKNQVNFSNITQNPIEKNIIQNPFLAKTHAVPDISTNPFAKNQSNFTNPFANNKPFTNPFDKTSSSSFIDTKPSFNFNLNQAVSNPNWEDEDEEGEDIDPEEEVKIKEEGSTLPKVDLPKSNSVKVIKISLEDLSVYNFEEKKYKSRGKGEISIELTKTEKEIVVAYLVYRNSALVSLFNAQILKGVTSLQSVSKNFKFFGVVQKLAGKSESTGKAESKSVKLNFISEKESDVFKGKFNGVLKILESNDDSHFPKEKKAQE